MFCWWDSQALFTTMFRCFTFSFTMSDSTTDECFILPPVLEIGVVSRKTHRTWNNATTATGLVLFTTASSQLWFSITLHLVVMSVSLEWQCQILPKPLTTPVLPLPKRAAKFCTDRNGLQEGNSLQPATAAVSFDFQVYPVSCISDICFLCTEYKEAKEHRTLHNPIPHEPNRKPWSIKGPIKYEAWLP